MLGKVNLGPSIETFCVQNVFLNGKVNSFQLYIIKIRVVVEYDRKNRGDLIVKGLKLILRAQYHSGNIRTENADWFQVQVDMDISVSHIVYNLPNVH